MQNDDNTNQVTKCVVVGSLHRFEMTHQQLIQYLSEDEVARDYCPSDNLWVFADGQRVDPAQLSEADWEAIDSLILVPMLIGGPNSG